MLSFLYTENYKNLKFDGKVDLKNLNIFIGPNGSGKSNLISYLKFLNQCFIGSSDSSRQVSAVDLAFSELNRILDINLPIPAQVRLVYGLSNKEDYLSGLVLDSSLYIWQSLGGKAIINKDFLYKGLDLEENLDNPYFYYKYLPPQQGEGLLSNNINRYFMGDIKTLNDFGTYTMWVSSIVSNWRFYNSNNMDLNIIRTSEPKIGPSDNLLSTTGDNLALVVDNLSQDLDFEDALNLAMKSIFPKTRRIRSARVGRLSLTIEWHIEGNNEPFYLNEMSDGTVRMLCWAVILHSPQFPSLLVIDEPELGLHPAWLSVLAQWIKQASEKTQIILTTHSPDLLDHFTDRLENVYCFYPTDANHYGLKPLSPEVLKPQLEEGWELGDLYRVGDPTVGGWPW
jgi:predicted ATPase